jgi:hypothetical protein
MIVVMRVLLFAGNTTKVAPLWKERGGPVFANVWPI